MAECTRFPVSINANPKNFLGSIWSVRIMSSFSQYSNYSLYAVKNRHYVNDDFLLFSCFLLFPSWISSWIRPQGELVLGLFLSCLAACSLWNNVFTFWNCSNGRPHPVLPCNLSWSFLGLDTLSSHVLAVCIHNRVPLDWLCNWTPHCCKSIWVILGLESLFFCVLECYTRNSYSAHWLCNQNPPQTTMSWLVMLSPLWHPFYFQELI